MQKYLPARYWTSANTVAINLHNIIQKMLYIAGDHHRLYTDYFVMLKGINEDSRMVYEKLYVSYDWANG